MKWRRSAFLYLSFVMLQAVSRFSNRSIHRRQWSPIVGRLHWDVKWHENWEGRNWCHVILPVLLVMLLEVLESFTGTWRAWSHYPHCQLCPDVQSVMKQSRQLHNERVQFVTLPSFFSSSSRLPTFLSGSLLFRSKRKTQPVCSMGSQQLPILEWAFLFPWSEDLLLHLSFQDTQHYLVCPWDIAPVACHICTLLSLLCLAGCRNDLERTVPLVLHERSHTGQSFCAGWVLLSLLFC